MPTVQLAAKIPHAGQARVLDAMSRSRFAVWRCGRRWGKTTGLVIAAENVMLEGMPVGYFAADFRRLEEAWESIKFDIAPIPHEISVKNRTIRLQNGGKVEFWSLHGEGGTNAGRGRKYALACVDEAGIVSNLKQAWRGAIRPTLTDYAGQAIFASTSKFEYPFFNQLFLRGASGERDWVSFQCKTIENPSIDPAEVEAARRDMPPWQAAQEFDGVAVEGGWQVFKTKDIDAHKAKHARPPDRIGNLVWRDDRRHSREDCLGMRKLDAFEWVDDERGMWKLWCPLQRHGGLLRPPQDQPLVMACDLADGVGSSNTVFSVVNADTREKWGEFANSLIVPEKAALEAATAGLWFGGSQRSCLINFERNGGRGKLFVRNLLRFAYPQIVRERQTDTAHETDTPNYGWWSTTAEKETLLGDYRAALNSDRFINRSEPALSECLTYIVDENNNWVVSRDDDDDVTDDMAREPHADRVTADALAYATCQQVRRAVPDEMPPQVQSMGWRRARAAKKPDAEDDW